MGKDAREESLFSCNWLSVSLADSSAHEFAPARQIRSCPRLRSPLRGTMPAPPAGAFLTSQPDGLMDISWKKRCSQIIDFYEMRMSFELLIRRKNDNP